MKENIIWALKIIGHRSFCSTILWCIKRTYVYLQYQSIIHGSDHFQDEDCTDMRPHMAG